MEFNMNDYDQKMTNSNQQEYLQVNRIIQQFKLFLDHFKSIKKTLDKLKILYQNQDTHLSLNQQQDIQITKNQNTDDDNSTIDNQKNHLNFKNVNDYKINLRKFIEINKKLNNSQQKQQNDLQNNKQILTELKSKLLRNQKTESNIMDSQQSNVDKFQRQNNLKNLEQKQILGSSLLESYKNKLQYDSNEQQFQQETNKVQIQDDSNEENIKEMSIVNLVQTESFEKQIQIDSDVFQDTNEVQIEQRVNIIEIQDESDADKIYLRSEKKKIQQTSDEQQIFDSQIVDNYEENNNDQIYSNSISKQIQQEQSYEDQIKQQSVMVQNQSENNKEYNNKQLYNEKCKSKLNNTFFNNVCDLSKEKKEQNQQSVQNKKKNILDLNRRKISSLLIDKIEHLQENEPKHKIQNLIYEDGPKNYNIANNHQKKENSYQIKSVWNNLMENKTDYEEFQRNVQNYQNNKNVLPLYVPQNFSFEQILPQQKDDKITEKDQEDLQKQSISQFQTERKNHPNEERILHKKKQKGQKQNIPFTDKLQTMVEEEKRNKNIQDNCSNPLSCTKIMEKNQYYNRENDKQGKIVQDDELIQKISKENDKNQKVQFFKNLLDKPNNNLEQEKQKLQQLVSCIDRLVQFQTQQSQLSTEYLNLFNDTIILKKSMNPQIQKTIEHPETKNSQEIDDLDRPMRKMNDQKEEEQSQQTAADNIIQLQNKNKIKDQPRNIKQNSSQKLFVSKYVEDSIAQILKSPQKPFISQYQVDPIPEKLIIGNEFPENKNHKQKKKKYKKGEKKIIEDDSCLNVIEKMQKARYDGENDGNSESCQQQYYEDKDGYELPIWNQDLGKMVSRYVCKACKTSLYSLNSLKNHCITSCRRLQKKYAYLCQYCQKGFRSEIKKLNHEIKHGNIQENQSGENTIKKIKISIDQTSINQDVEFVQINGYWQCQKCRKLLVSKAGLRSHLNINKCMIIPEIKKKQYKFNNRCIYY